MKLKLLVAAALGIGMLMAMQGVASAGTYGGYFTGATTNDSAYWTCNVLGAILPGYTQASCVSETNGVSHQYDALTWLPGACPTNDSNCLKANLTTYLAGKLDTGAPTDLEHSGASFIVDKMRGTNAGRSFNSSSAVFADWKARVNDSRVTAKIITSGFSQNTAFDPFTNDDYTYPDPGEPPVAMLMFYVNGTPYFAIKLDCGNPVGSLTPLPQPNQTPVGNFVAGSCNTLTGWLYDPDSTGSPAQFNVYVNGTKTGPLTASLSSAGYGVGGNHAFSVSTEPLSGLNPRAANTIIIRAIDMQTGAEYNITNGTRSVGPCTAATCKTTTFPASMAVGQSQSFEVYIDLNYVGSPSDPVDWGAPYHRDNGSGGSNDPRMYVTIKDPSGATIAPSGTVNYTAGPSDNTPNLASYTVNFTPVKAGTYTVQWGLTGAVTVTCGAGGSGGGGGTGESSFEPFFTVTGGDVAAGPGFGTACTPDTTAEIEGFNMNNGAYFGAGGQLGVMALGTITSFPSAQSAVSPAGSSPSDLSFANTTTNPAAFQYGGGYDKPNWCVPDYVAAATPTTTDPPDWDLPDTPPGTYVYHVDGDLGIPNLTLENGQVVTVVVDGNAYISGNIRYQPYNNVTEIPQFRLLVTGNIYVDNGVTELHGFYNAQPKSGVADSGHFHTCALSMGNPTTDYADCKQKLTVYGAVSAAHIDLERTYGNLIAVSGTPAAPAEQFIMTPELWVGGRFGSTTNPSAAPYQSATSLPPVL